MPSTSLASRIRMPHLTAKFVVGLMTATLIASAGLPALAGDPRAAEGSKQQHDVSAAKKKGGKTVTRTFSSTDAILIPEEASVEFAFGAADPYPSTISAKGFKNAKVTDVNLTLNGLTHEFSRDIDVMLVSPNGRNAVVLGDIGRLSAIVDVTLTLDDEAAEPLPTEEALTSGTFRPLDNLGPVDDDNPSLRGFLSPAPAPSGRDALSTFDGIDPNGQWRLFIIDDAETDTGTLEGGWTLEITAKSKAKQKRKHGRRH